MSTVGVMNAGDIAVKGTILYFDDTGNKVRTDPVDLGPNTSMANAVPQVTTPYVRAMLFLDTDNGKALLYSVTTDSSLRPNTVRVGTPVRIVK